MTYYPLAFVEEYLSHKILLKARIYAYPVHRYREPYHSVKTLKKLG